MQIEIQGIGIWSALGRGWPAHRAAFADGRTAFSRLDEVVGFEASNSGLVVGAIGDRGALAYRKYSPATNLGLAVARDAVADAGVDCAKLRDAALVVGSSRGNAAGWLSEWPGRRPVKLLAASNSMHNEIASAVSIELGITGPCHVLANGCSAGLAAVDMARMLILSGTVKHALVVGVDLPLCEVLLDVYAKTGLLSRNGVNDPYDSRTTGFFPAEAGAAMWLSAEVGDETSTCPRLVGTWVNSDASDLVGVPHDGGGVARLAAKVMESLDGKRLRAVCPHASGTLVHGQAESRALREILVHMDGDVPTVHLMKPWTGHSMGASGAVDLAILAAAMRDGELPPNLPGLCGVGDCARLPERFESIVAGETVVKIASGMGGQNVIAALEAGPGVVDRGADGVRFDELVVDVNSQTMRAYGDGEILRTFPVSTAKNGIGFDEGSYKTPTGNFVIDEMFGEKEPLDMVFQGRQPVGAFGSAFDAESDHVVARVMWLHGLDEANANSKERFIYIHGTNHEELIGQPASHGCVRLRNADVAELFAAVSVGSAVRIDA